MTGWMSECPARKETQSRFIFLNQDEMKTMYIEDIEARSNIELHFYHGVRSHAKILISDRSSRICFLTLPLHAGWMPKWLRVCFLPPLPTRSVLMIEDSQAFSILFCTEHAFRVFPLAFFFVGNRLMAGEKIRRKKDLKQRRKLNKKQ